MTGAEVSRSEAIRRYEATPLGSETASLWRARGAETDEGLRSIRVALLGTDFLEPLVPFVGMESLRLGVRPEIYVGPFGAVETEILDAASGLAAFAPRALVLVTSPEATLGPPDLWPFTEVAAERRARAAAAAERLVDLAATAAERWGADVLTANWPVPGGALGGADWSREAGLGESVHLFNLALGEGARRAPGVRVLDLHALACARGMRSDAEEKNRYIAGTRLPAHLLPPLARRIAGTLLALAGGARKCVVLDLDGTLWGGVLDESGAEGIRLGPEPPGNVYVEFQRALLGLRRRGVLLAVSTHADREEALAVIRSHPGMVLREEDFAVIEAGPADKADQIRAVAEALGIGLDALVFIDDDPVVRGRIRAAFPEVEVPETPRDAALLRPMLLDIASLDGASVTDDDLRRTERIAADRPRAAARRAAPSLEAYLGTLETEVDVRPAETRDVPRIAQLTQRTNRFNLSALRLSEAEVRSAWNDGGPRWFVMNVRDRFSDLGLAGAMRVRAPEGDAWEIDGLCVSCRALGRRAEAAFVAVVAGEAVRAGARSLRSRYAPTPKNAAAAGFYRDCGLSPLDADGLLWGGDAAAAAARFPSVVRRTAR